MSSRPLNTIIIEINDLLTAWQDMEEKKQAFQQSYGWEDATQKEELYQNALVKTEQTGEGFLDVCERFDAVLFTKPIPAELQKEKFFQDFVKNITLYNNTRPFKEEGSPKICAFSSPADISKQDDHNYCIASTQKSVLAAMSQLKLPLIRVSLFQDIRNANAEPGGYYDQKIFQGLKDREISSDVLQRVSADFATEIARLEAKKELAEKKGDNRNIINYQKRKKQIENALQEIHSKQGITYNEVKEIIIKAADSSFTTGSWLSRLLGIASTGARNLQVISNNFFLFKPQTTAGLDRQEPSNDSVKNPHLKSSN